jgi:hypothetical protein
MAEKCTFIEILLVVGYVAGCGHPFFEVGSLLMACAVQRRRYSVGANPTRQNAPAGSNRSNYEGNEMVEAFG